MRIIMNKDIKNKTITEFNGESDYAVTGYIMQDQMCYLFGQNNYAQNFENMRKHKYNPDELNMDFMYDGKRVDVKYNHKDPYYINVNIEGKPADYYILTADADDDSFELLGMIKNTDLTNGHRLRESGKPHSVGRRYYVLQRQEIMSRLKDYGKKMNNRISYINLNTNEIEMDGIMYEADISTVLSFLFM